jgi:predicted O-methyltransferase YrrM
MKKIFMFVPAFGQQVTAATFMTTHALQQSFTAKGIQSSISTLSFPDIAELRSMIATIWYDSMPEFQYLLFIDSDMGFPPDMVLDMLHFDEGVVGAIYPQRNLPVSWAGSGTGGTSTARRGNFMEVEGVGMGCTLIRRDAMHAIVQKYPELNDTRIAMQPYAKILQSGGTNRLLRVFEKMDIPDRGMVSEDLSFCIRHRQCGGTVWAAINYKISHVGPYDYGQSYLEVTERTAGESQRQEAMAQALLTAQQNAVKPQVDPRQRLADLAQEFRHENGPNDASNKVGGLIDLINAVKPETVLEIGAHKGVSTEAFALICKQVYTVDTWPDARALEEFKLRMSKYPNVAAIQGASPDALQHLPSAQFDMVYIDGDHSYDAVAKDIAIARKLVKDGGVIAGHDYNDIEYFSGIKRAVTEAFGKPEQTFGDGSWMVSNRVVTLVTQETIVGPDLIEVPWRPASIDKTIIAVGKRRAERKRTNGAAKIIANAARSKRGASRAKQKSRSGTAPRSAGR